MAVTNIAQGGNKAVKVTGLADVTKRITAMRHAASARGEAAQIIAGTARGLYGRVQGAARSVNLPRRAQADIFEYSRQPNTAGRRNSITALVGVRKLGRSKDAKGYVRWRAGAQSGRFEKKFRARKRSKAATLVAAGSKIIGESLATMWELGTSKMAARPWFRRTVSASRSDILADIANGYRGILQRLSAN